MTDTEKLQQLVTKLKELAKKLPEEDPYADIEDSGDLYCGNEDDARELGERHADATTREALENILMSIGEKL